MSAREVTAYSITSLSGTVSVSGKARRATVFSSSSLGGSVVMSGKTRRVTANSITSLGGSVRASGKTKKVSISSRTSLGGSVDVSGKLRAIQIRSSSSLTGSVFIAGTSSMTLYGVVQEILTLWGVFCPTKAQKFMLERAVNDVNSALQTVWNQAKDRNYWTNETIEVTIANGVSSIALDQTIQNVTGTCRRKNNRRPMVSIGTIGELETFVDNYLDGDTTTSPIAYHIERAKQSGSEPSSITLHVVPAVSEAAGVAFLIEVVKEAPRFQSADIFSYAPIPIPHKYVETLFLPIARYKASSFYLFVADKQKEAIERDYQMAMAAIGDADPLPGQAGDNREQPKQSK